MNSKRVLQILLLVFHVLWQADANVTENNEESIKNEVFARIVNGSQIDDRTKWPWLVAFKNNEENKYFCSGTLISSRHVLSGEQNIT